MSLLFLLACPKDPDVTAPHPLDAHPVVAAAPDFIPPAALAVTLDNGIPVWVHPQPGLPLVAIKVLVDGGRSQDPLDGAGLTAFSDRLLSHGAGERDASAFAETLEQAAITLSVGTTDHNTRITVDTHADRVDLALELLADAMLRPAFDGGEVDKVREQVLGDIAQSQDEPREQARVVSNRLFFGLSPLGLPSPGTVDSITPLSSESLANSWAARLHAGAVHIVVTGAVQPEAIRQALNAHLGSLEAGEAGAPTTPIPPRTGQFLVHAEEAPQSVIRLVLPGWSIDDPDLNAARMGAIVLGGTFTSRLNTILREEKGWTYGARLSVYPEDGPGSRVVFQSSVVAEHTGDAVEVLLEQLALAATDGITPDELAKAQGARRTSIVSALGSRGQTASTLGHLVSWGLQPDAMQTELAALPDITVEAVNAQLKKLNPASGVLLVVGDRESVTPQLSGTWTEETAW